MAEENENGQERSEEPTAKRLREAKEKGQVPRSQELNTTLGMLAAAGGLLLLGPYMGESLMGVVGQLLQVDRETIFDPDASFKLLRWAVGQGLLLVGPFALLMLLVSLVAPISLGGWAFSAKSWAPKFEKINPLKGLKRIYGPQGLMNLVKALAKVLVVGAVSAVLLWSLREQIESLAIASLYEGISHGATLIFGAFFALSAGLILVAAVDVPWQIHSHIKKLKMTKQEVKDEFKETEGKPEVKGRIRQLQREMAQRRMMENVPNADVIVTNPTHFAVALKYDQLKMGAPRVVAKGTDLVAQRIRELARENKVPLFEAPPLARALYHTTEIDREIPAGLYLAVAQVLAYIYQLRGGAAAARPAKPRPDIPEEFEKYASQGRPSEDE